MEITVLKNIIKRSIKGFSSKNARIRKAELYYENKNDILRRKNPVEEKIKEQDSNNALRNADNRVSIPWHSLLVDQKASYTMSVPPTFDVGEDDLNEEVTKILGDQFAKVAKDLSVNASNAGVAWVHYWVDADYNNFFRYAVIDTKQIIPIYSKRLTNELEGVLRIYEDYDEQGDTLVVYEYWTDKECQVVSKKKKEDFDELQPYQIFNQIDNSTDEVVGATNVYVHDFGAVPFIPFRNNPKELPDLRKYKKLIDVYDKVYSGFINDIDDIQEVILVLTNYGGQEKQEFLDDLKRYKMVKLELDGEEQTSLETLAIEIPIEARTKILEMTRELLFLQGQGVDPLKNIGQNNSGSALEYMYTLLELKSSMLETEFRLGFAELVRSILRYSNKDADVTIEQKWMRTSIKDDAKIAEIINKLAPVTSKESIAKNNPLVEDWQEELNVIEKETTDSFRSENDYRPDVREDGQA